MKTLLALALCIGLSGCAASSVIVTGTKRPPIEASAVTVYPETPEGAQTIAIIEAEGASWNRQSETNAVIEKLKADAARLGANGIVIMDQGSRLRGTKDGPQAHRVLIKALAVFVQLERTAPGTSPQTR